MADFYQKVATPQTQFRQQRSDSGPSVDANARAQAQNSAQNNIGSAIMSLIGTSATISNIKDTQDDLNKKKMYAENRLNIKADTHGLASFMDVELKARAKKDGKGVEDYSDQEIKNILNESSDSFSKAHNLSEKEYFSLTQEAMEEKKLAVLDRQLNINTETRKNKKYNTFVNEAKTIFKVSEDPQVIVASMDQLLKTSVGFENVTIQDENGKDITYQPEIQDTQENAKLRLIQPMVEDVMSSKDPKALRMLESKEMKEFFKDVPDYDNLVNAAKFQVQSTLNKNRQISYDKIEESAYFAMDSGLFTSAKDVDSYIDEQLSTLGEDNVPDTKDILRLKGQLSKSMQEELNFQGMYAALKSGDYTVLERSSLKKKEIESVQNKLFSTETGITDLSPEGINTAIKSGEFDAPIKKYFNEGYPIPPHLEKWANTPPSGGIDGIRTKYESFMQLQSLTQDTSKTALDVFNPKEYSRMMFVGNMLSNLDSGTIDNKQAHEIYSSFNNDVSKNVDSYGTFVSTKAAQALETNEVKEWLSNVKSDAPWTYDEFSSQAYIERQYKNYFSYGMEATDNPEEAQEMAEKMFSSRHVAFENPDGSEGIIPNEFKQFAVNSSGSTDIQSFIDVAKNAEPFQNYMQVAGFKGRFKDFSFERNLSFKPNPSYERNQLMNFYYDGKFVMQLTPDQMRENVSRINSNKKKQAEDRNVNTTQAQQ